jgi:hypothetical protein
MFAAVLLLAAVLRFYKLGVTSLWTDELFTAFYPRDGLSFIWTEGLRTEPTSPLYFSLIWAVEHVAGDSAFVLRLPSVAGSLLGIALAGLLARELFERRAASIFAGLLLALAPTNIFYAQEARGYALQGAALALALFGFARFLRERDRAGPLALYGTGATLAIYFHPTSLIAVAAINLAALFSVVGRGRLLDAPALLRWCAVNAIVAVLCLPLVPTLLSPSIAAAVNWIPALSRWSLEELIGVTLAGPTVGEHAMAIAEIAIPLLAVIFLVPPWRPGRRAATVLLLAPGLFLVLMIAISLHRPVLLGRTLAWTLVPLAVALGDVLARRTKVIALVVLAGLATATALHFSRVELLKEDWRGFLARLPDLSPPALIVLAPHTPPAALARYAPDAATPVQMEDPGPPVAETLLTTRLFGTKTITRADLAAAIDSGRPVWLIYRRPEYQWMLRTTAGLPPPKRAVQDIEGSNAGMRALFW